MRILVVDDEAGIREGLAALLRLRGHDVRTAADVAAAEQLLGDGAFELLLTDWRLPDGTAEPLLRRGVPGIAISGHPEEVTRAPGLLAVLGKPVPPPRLLAMVAEIAAATPVAPPVPSGADALPADVGAVVRRALALLAGADGRAAAELVDDGTFVTLRAPWPGDDRQAGFEALGGDLRVLAPGNRPMLELRWCRDGRPGPDVLVVTPAAGWPAGVDFCVDWHDHAADEAAWFAALDRAAAARAAGVRVEFLNVPAALRVATADAGRAGDLRVPDRIGPHLPTELVDLWR
ncbi:MAG: response regulator [Planctomycetota bacterium]